MRRSRRSATACTAALLPVAMLLATGRASAADEDSIRQDPGPPPFTIEHGLPRHSGTYQRPRIVWEPDPRLVDVRAVHPHPVRGDQAFVVAGDGIHRTDNGGRSWHHLTGIGIDQPATVTCLTFRHGHPDTILAGTENQGLWVSENSGETWRCLAAATNGLAADRVAHVAVYPADPTYRTLMAAHGQSPGLSVSDDVGRTWQVQLPDRCLYRILVGRPGVRELYVLAAHRNQPDVIGLHHLASLGQFPRELLSDLLPTDAAVPLAGGHGLVLGTVDSGLFRVTRHGSTVQRIGPETLEWASVALSWASHADGERLWLYEPQTLGAILTTDDLENYLPCSTGMYRGGLVREGSRLRTNAGGTLLLAAVNGMLYVGRNRAPFRVEEVKAEPGVFTIEAAVFDGRRWENVRRDLDEMRRSTDIMPYVDGLLDQLSRLDAAIPNAEIALTARVRCPADPGLERVTADLSRVGGSHRTPMFDDGMHRDGEPGDGIYGTHVLLTRRGLKRHDREWRAVRPGRTGLSVTAVARDGALAGAVGALAVYIRPDTFTFYAEHEDVRISREGSEGEVSGERRRDRELAFEGDHCFVLEVGPGHWLAPVGNAYAVHTVTGYYALSFMIRGDAAAINSMHVALRDNPDYMYPTTTRPLPLAAGDYVVDKNAISDQHYSRVVIPLADLTDAGAFKEELLGWVVFSGGGSARQRICIDNVRFFVNRAELARDMEENQP